MYRQQNAPLSLDMFRGVFLPASLYALFTSAALLLGSLNADAAHPVPAITPLEKEQDLLDKKRLEEKISRELEANRQRVQEELQQKRRKTVPGTLPKQKKSSSDSK